jgi:hypothetical protein
VLFFPQGEQMKVLIAVTLLCGFCFAQDEPIKFRGAYLGEPVTDFVDCSSSKGKLIKDGYKLHGHACESNGIVSRIKVHGSFAKAASRDGEELYFENQKLVRMKIYVPDDDWDKVRYDLSQKLGEPVSEPPQVYQNGFGARWEYGQGFWMKGDTVAYAGVKVGPVGGLNFTHGIEISITDSTRAKVASSTPSTLD